MTRGLGSTVFGVGCAVLTLAAALGCEDRCRSEPVCAENGACEESGDVCIAVSDADCRRATVCARDGWCKAAHSTCVAADAADCRRSETCRTEGACTARDEHCVAVSDADCRSAVVCGTEGRCSFQARFDNRACAEARGEMVVDGAEFVVPTDLSLPGVIPGDGRPSLPQIPLGCRNHCTVRTAADCAASEACRSEGRCAVRSDPEMLHQRWCVRPEHATPQPSEAAPPAAEPVAADPATANSPAAAPSPAEPSAP